MALQVGADPAPKDRVAEEPPKHVQTPRTTGVEVVVVHVPARVELAGDDGAYVALGALVEVVRRAGVEVVGEVVGAGVVLVPTRLHVSSPRLLEPGVRVVATDDVVSEPGVGHLVEIHDVDQALHLGRSRLREHEGVVPGDQRDVLHRATHEGRRKLVVLRVGERNAELLGHPVEHLFGAIEAAP